MMPEKSTKAILSVSQMCRVLKMSRSQFYEHVKRGTFHAPLHLTANNRPYFTAAMVAENLQARETGIAVNGDYVIFYERQPSSPKTESKKVAKASHPSLLEALKKSSLKEVTSEQIEAALAVCFPNGTDGKSESDVLRIVYRHLKRSGGG